MSSNLTALLIPPFTIRAHINPSLLFRYVHAFEGVSSNVVWEESGTSIVLILYFLAECEASDVSEAQNKIHFVLNCHNLPPLENIKICAVPHKNWAEEPQDISNVQIGLFQIIPPEQTAQEEHIPIFMTPGAAFGSGTHPTTQGCLKALSYLKDHTKTHILDMGCGSGILSIAAKSMFQNAQVLCVDVDPLAIYTTTTNFELNQLQPPHTCVSEGFTDIHKGSFDLIFANILANPLCEMAKNIKGRLQPQGHAIISGFLGNTLGDIIECYKQQFLIVVDQIIIEGWYTLTLKHA